MDGSCRDGHYQSAAALYRDIDLVFTNCKLCAHTQLDRALARSELGYALRRYNEPTSEIGKAGRRIQSAFSRIVRTKLAVPQENAYEPSSGKGARQR